MKSPHVTKVLISLAQHMCDHPDQFSEESGRDMDRALRTHPDISDIDPVWVRWGYVAGKHGWLTNKEMVFKKGKYTYESTA